MDQAVGLSLLCLIDSIQDLCTGSLIPGQARYRGFCDALSERGLALAPEDIFEAASNATSGAQAGVNIALGVMSGLRTCGLRVPEDVSIMGFDNLEASKYVYPALTTVAQDIDKKCDTACDLLFQMIEKITANKILDIELVERQSVWAIEP